MSAIQVSIIIPVHERYLFLKECIQSVVNQTIENKEILCILDGECETSRRIIEEIAQDKVTIIAKKKEGAWAARNLGIELSQGEYLCFMDSDDYYPSTDSLNKLYVAARENGANICGGNLNTIYEDGRFEPWGDVFWGNGFINTEECPQMYGHTRYLYKREFLTNNKIKNEKLRRFEDPPFVLKAFIKANRYYTIKDVIYNCRYYKRDSFYNFKTLVDILRGIEKCTEMLADVSYKRLYKCHVYGAIESVYTQYICFLEEGNEEVYQLISRIKKNLIELDYDELDILDCSRAKEIVKEKKDLINKINAATKISVYGAGQVARRVIESGFLDLQKVNKCFVSKITNGHDYFFGFDISSIYNIDKEANDLVIVAADGNNAKEMIEVLEQIAYNNYCMLGSRDLSIISQLNQMDRISGENFIR